MSEQKKTNFIISMIQYTIVLAVIAAASGGILFYVNSKTRDRIAENQKKKIEKSLKEVLPDATAPIEPVRDDKNNPLYYIGKDTNGKLIGYAAPGEAKGYSSVIEVIVGVSTDFKIQGVSIKNSQETPGLGERIKEIKKTVTITDKIMTDKEEEKNPKPWFLKQFTGKTPEQISTGTGIDAITGATISSRAVTTAVSNALTRLKTHLGKGASRKNTAPPLLKGVTNANPDAATSTETE
mgnify:CR=1 FL=1